MQIERMNIVTIITVHIAQSGQNTQTMNSWEMTYELKSIPPAASPVRIFAGSIDFEKQPQSAMRKSTGYTMAAIIGKATLKSQTENIMARGFWRIPEQESVSEISHGIIWRAAASAPFQ